MEYEIFSYHISRILIIICKRSIIEQKIYHRVWSLSKIHTIKISSNETYPKFQLKRIFSELIVKIILYDHLFSIELLVSTMRLRSNEGNCSQTVIWVHALGLPHEVLGVEFTHGQFPLLFSLPPHFPLFRKLYL